MSFSKSIPITKWITDPAWLQGGYEAYTYAVSAGNPTNMITTDRAGNDVRDMRGAPMIPAGAAYPANDSSCIGLTMSPVSATTGGQVSVVRRGMIDERFLPQDLSAEAVEALRGAILNLSGAFVNSSAPTE